MNRLKRPSRTTLVLTPLILASAFTASFVAPTAAQAACSEGSGSFTLALYASTQNNNAMTEFHVDRTAPYNGGNSILRLVNSLRGTVFEQTFGAESDAYVSADYAYVQNTSGATKTYTYYRKLCR